MTIYIFDNDNEIPMKPGEAYILAGMGNEAFIKKSMENPDAVVVVPKTVAQGEANPKSYIKSSIASIISRNLKPVIVIPHTSKASFATDRENEYLASFDDYGNRVDIMNIAAAEATDIYVQSIGTVYKIKHAIELSGKIMLFSDTKNSVIYEIGNVGGDTRDFRHRLYEAAVYNISDESAFNGLDLDRCISKLYDKAIDIDRAGRNKFSLLIHLRDTSNVYGSAFEMPDEYVMARIILAMNYFSKQKKSIFYSVVHTQVDAEYQAKLNALKDRFKKPIKEVFERSIAMRDSSKDVTAKEMESWKTLETSFPNIDFNRVDLTFIDSDETARIGRKKTRPVSELMAPKKLKPIESETQRQKIVVAVNYLNNKRRDRTEKATIRSESALAKFSTSVMKNEVRKNKLAEAAVKKVIGRYPIDDLHDFIITDDPVALFAKSTGQDWEESSCEKDGGSHNQGVYSDIEIGNCVAFIVENENDHPIARMMLRWCNKDDGTVGFGVEKRWYYTVNPGAGTKMGFTDKNPIYKGMTGLKATALLVKILVEKGVYDYKICTTPYQYDGYSDMMGTSKTRIEYRNLIREYKSVKFIVEGTKFSFEKESMEYIYTLVSNYDISMTDLKPEELEILYKRIAGEENNNVYAAGIIPYIFTGFGLFSSEAKKFLGYIEKPSLVYKKTIESINSLFVDTIDRSKDFDEMRTVIEWPFFKKIPAIITHIFGRIFTAAPPSEIARVPDLVDEYGDHPYTLMALLGIYAVSSRIELFDKSLKALSKKYDRKRIIDEIKQEDRLIRSGVKCENNRAKFVSVSKDESYEICEINAEKYFVTKSWRDPYDLRIGIRIVTDGGEKIPYGYPADLYKATNLTASTYVDRLKKATKQLEASAEKLGIKLE